VDRIRLIELIEGQTAQLSAEGRGLSEELEFLRESIPDPDDPSRMDREYAIMERVFGLPVAEQFPHRPARGADSRPSPGRGGGTSWGVRDD
jgi:hypothetical protein